MNASKQAGSREGESQSGDSSEHLQSSIDSKSVRKMSESSVAKKAIGKADARYWQQKGKLVTDPRSRFLTCKIQVNGRRESFPLRSSNKANAAAKAAQIFGDVVALGWTDALLKHKPDESKPSGIATIGQYLTELYSTVTFRKSTGRAYEQALRTIAAGIAGIGDQPALDETGQVQKDKKGHVITVSRRDHNHGGHLVWRSKVDAVSLSLLTGEKIQKWKMAYLAEAGDSPLNLQKAKHTANSMIRSARSLFSNRKGRLKHLLAKLTMPEPWPFAGVALEEEGTMRYVSKVDGRKLIQSAKKDLADNPERKEEFKIFCLGLLAGLRKREIDTLLWEQVKFDSGMIHICRTQYFEPKSKESEAKVDCEPELLMLLQVWKAQATGEFVVESKGSARYHKTRWNYYRAEGHFKALYDWLEKQGIKDDKKLHTLRKELGSILANEQGIFAAQQVLRHAHIQTTSRHYADKRRSITAGLGVLLSDGKPTPPKTDEGRKTKRRINS